MLKRRNKATLLLFLLMLLEIQPTFSGETSTAEMLLNAQDTSIVDLLKPLFSGFIGALILLFIKDYLLKPKFSIEFRNDSYFHPVTKMKYKDDTAPPTQAKYLRFRVVNKGRFFLSISALNCRAYLSHLEVVDNNGKTSRIGEDWIALPFSNSDNKTMIDLPTGVPQFVDILFTRQDHLNELCPALIFPLKDYDILRMSGTFTAHLSVVADNASVTHKKIQFKWSAGNFDSLQGV